MKNRISRIVFSAMTTIMAFIYTAVPAFAAEAGNNIIAESVIFKGIMRFLNDITFVLLVAAPAIGAILIIVFSIMNGGTTHEQDKDKFKKYRTNVIFAMCWVFGASAIINVVTLYLQ